MSSLTSFASRPLAEILEAVERRKHDKIRAKLGIPEALKIEGLQLESLGFQLIERSGEIQVKLEGDQLRVGDPESSGGLIYHGDAIGFILSFWKIKRSQAQAGIRFEVHMGIRVTS